MDIEVTVQSVLTDPKTDTQIVLLKSADDPDKVLPIWVGAVEGNAIRFALEGIKPPRPMTHDLLKDMMDHMAIRLQKIIITDVKGNTFYAMVYIEVKGKTLTVDSRPSDAIALAVRNHAPIYASRDVLKKKSGEEVDRWLNKMDPENKDTGD